MRGTGIAALALWLSFAGSSAFADFDTADIARYHASGRSTLSPADRTKMTSPTLDDATMAIMTRVLETIRADRKE